MADFDYDDPAVDGPPRLLRRSREAQPVLYRLIGTREDIAAHLAVLSQVLELTNVSDPIRSKWTGSYRVYAIGTRRYPLTGGIK